MYVGRDMTELSMIPKSEWKESELAFFHHSLQQIVPYLNSRRTIHSSGNYRRNRKHAAECTMTKPTYTHGTKISYD